MFVPLLKLCNIVCLSGPDREFYQDNQHLKIGMLTSNHIICFHFLKDANQAFERKAPPGHNRTIQVNEIIHMQCCMNVWLRLVFFGMRMYIMQAADPGLH